MLYALHEGSYLALSFANLYYSLYETVNPQKAKIYVSSSSLLPYLSLLFVESLWSLNRVTAHYSKMEWSLTCSHVIFLSKLLDLRYNSKDSSYSFSALLCPYIRKITYYWQGLGKQIPCFSELWQNDIWSYTSAFLDQSDFFLKSLITIWIKQNLCLSFLLNPLSFLFLLSSSFLCLC